MNENQYQTDGALVKRNTAVGGAASEDTQEIDLLLLFDALRRHILIIIAVALLFALGAGVVVQFFITPMYTATTSTYLVSAGGGLSDILSTSDLTIASNIAGDYSAIIKSRTILEGVIAEMDLPYTYSQLNANVAVSNPSNTHIIKITVTDASPQLAKNIANTLTHYAVERLADIMEISEPNVYDEAVAPTKASSPNLTKAVAIAFVLGAVLAAGVIVVIAIMDTTIKTAEDIENRCGMVTLTKVYYEGGKKRKGYGYGYGKGYGYGYGYGSTSRSEVEKKNGKSDKNGGAQK